MLPWDRRLATRNSLLRRITTLGLSEALRMTTTARRPRRRITASRQEVTMDSRDLMDLLHREATTSKAHRWDTRRKEDTRQEDISKIEGVEREDAALV